MYYFGMFPLFDKMIVKTEMEGSDDVRLFSLSSFLIRAKTTQISPWLSRFEQITLRKDICSLPHPF